MRSERHDTGYRVNDEPVTVRIGGKFSALPKWARRLLDRQAFRIKVLEAEIEKLATDEIRSALSSPVDERDQRREFLAQNALGVAEIAELLEVAPDTVRKWRTRTPTPRRGLAFPEPAIRLARGDVYLRADVEYWALVTGRLVTLVSDDGNQVVAVPPRR